MTKLRFKGRRGALILQTNKCPECQLKFKNRHGMLIHRFRKHPAQTVVKETKDTLLERIRARRSELQKAKAIRAYGIQAAYDLDNISDALQYASKLSWAGRRYLIARIEEMEAT